MKTGSINHAHNLYNQYRPPAVPGKGEEKNTLNDLWNPIDKYVPTIVEGTADPVTIEKLWNDMNHMAESIRKLVSSMIGKNDASGQGFWATKVRSGQKLSEADRAYAQELIGEDGFFGVKQTTQRIMDFAKALVGEGASSERIELMRDAVQKGFDEVARMFGGFDKFPDVTKQTYEAIMKAFDEWLAGSEGKTEAAA